jgi:hypothetical protein
VLLDERRPVQAELQRAFGGRARELGGRVEGRDAGAAAADVRLDEHREAEARRRRRRLGGVVHRPRSRVAEPEAREERALARLGDLDLEGGVPVDHVRADLLEVGEIVQRVEDRVGVAARPRRRAHPVDDEGVGVSLVARVEDQLACAQPRVVDPAPLELREERLEPQRMLVEDADRPVHSPSLPTSSTDRYRN